MCARPTKKCTIALLVLALAVSAAGAAQHLARHQAAVPAAAPPAEPTQLVVHEWGTFTTFSGSDGKNLEFFPVNDDLPRFVYESRHFGMLTKSGRMRPRDMMCNVSMETPVLYFYTDREVNASVTVDFPKGFMTEWYPQAQYRRDQDSAARQLSWRNFKLLPGAYVSLPRQGKADNHYYDARETDATPLEVAVNSKMNDVFDDERAFRTDKEYEKFLFYRGIGSFAVPLQVSAHPRCGNMLIKNTHKEPMAGVFMVNVKRGVLSFADMGSLKAGDQVRAPSLRQAPVSELGDALARLLVKQGLYEKEARAMVKTWTNAWFAEEGTRFLYILPAPMADELLPLKVEPRPTSLVRVFVGRHDVLTRPQEEQIDAANRRLRAAQAELLAAQQGLHGLGLGRFTVPAMKLSDLRITPPKQPRSGPDNNDD